MAGRVGEFSKILKMSQEELKQYCKESLKEADYNVVESDGFLFGVGKIPILLVAHLDTVHRKQPSVIYYDKKKSVIWAPEGIGGDDRCGVYMILRLIEQYKPYVLFTEDEEIGAVGACEAIKILKQPDVKFIIELDRRGNNDCVFYDCNNKEFKEYIKKFGFEENIGSFSDISVLADEWDIASVNLSSGYYNEHTTGETINIKDLKYTLKRVGEIILDIDNVEKQFDYQREVYPTYRSKYSFTDPNNQYEDNYGYVDKDGHWHYWNETV